MCVQHPTHPTEVLPCQEGWVRHVHERRAGAAAAPQPPCTSSDLFSQTCCWLANCWNLNTNPGDSTSRGLISELRTDMKCEGQRRFLSRLQQPVQWQCGRVIYRTGANEQCAASLGDLRDDRPRHCACCSLAFPGTRPAFGTAGGGVSAGGVSSGDLHVLVWWEVRLLPSAVPHE